MSYYVVLQIPGHLNSGKIGYISELGTAGSQTAAVDTFPILSTLNPKAVEYVYT